MMGLAEDAVRGDLITKDSSSQHQQGDSGYQRAGLGQGEESRSEPESGGAGGRGPQ